jgi:hypothetical protein
MRIGKNRLSIGDGGTITESDIRSASPLDAERRELTCGAGGLSALHANAPLLNPAQMRCPKFEMMNVS